MGHVYGDSTAFPHDVNFIELIRHAVECGVALLAAQHAISGASTRIANFEQLKTQERKRLDDLEAALKQAMQPLLKNNSERVTRATQSVGEAVRGVISSELSRLDGEIESELLQSNQTLEQSRQNSYRAIETFLLQHDLPDSECGLQLAASGETYSGQANLKTPFQIDGVFSLAIPPAHEWGKLRRVADLSAGTEVHLPLESGWLSKKIEVQSIKLDRLFIRAVVLADDRATIDLTKSLEINSAGYRFEVAYEDDDRIVTLTPIGDDGKSSTRSPFRLEGEDAIHLERLWTRVYDTTRDLLLRRETMTSARFDGKPLAQFAEPKALCERLVKLLAPWVTGIAKRSGAPGELVLRRDLGAGRREEIYITKAELHEKVLTLPPELRKVFAPFELSEGPRSPRAPSPSAPIVVNMDDVEEELTLPGRKE